MVHVDLILHQIIRAAGGSLVTEMVTSASKTSRFSHYKGAAILTHEPSPEN